MRVTWVGLKGCQGWDVFRAVVYRTVLPIVTHLSFSQVRWDCTLMALRRNGLCVFMSRKVKDCLK